MNEPEIKILAISNVFARLMHFKNNGDSIVSHTHEYDHGTLLSSGSVLYESLDDDKNVISSKVFKSPTFIFVPNRVYHKLTSLEDNTVCVCIHALRTIDNELLDPDFLIENAEFVEGRGDLASLIYEKTGQPMRPLLTDKKIEKMIETHNQYMSKSNE